MLQHIYPEQITSNVTYSLIGKRAIAGKRLHDLSSYTVIIIADELEDETLIKNIADDKLPRRRSSTAVRNSSAGIEKMTGWMRGSTLKMRWMTCEKVL
ncbi:hypothetical protein SAMN04487928_13734 [Butyrivibrio proteoclasticus]|uniref:Uncharacterized protein n=1 Tax=Butyrivibrio proteoclasticus TaxID=43305 RepID=A0A1I5XUH9_9FIRM|nr:hypothetical protein [Butyrivibrio proteoclasticus]SFQ35540.1 hypothetical protein SAMN04487928_13734 [Butyrivibrio proteoclasticus]